MCVSLLTNLLTQTKKQSQLTLRLFFYSSEKNSLCPIPSGMGKPDYRRKIAYSVLLHGCG